MASEGPLSPGTSANDASFGVLAWTNPDRAVSSNNSYATTGTIFGANDPTQYLKCTNFGFAIPGGSTIDGIIVEVERKSDASSTECKDSRVRIVKADGAIGTTDKASADIWPTTEAYKTYGTSSDLWGETWTAEQINDADFGMVIATTKHDSAGLGSIDHVRITVHYTAGASSAVQDVIMSGVVPFPR